MKIHGTRIKYMSINEQDLEQCLKDLSSTSINDVDKYFSYKYTQSFFGLKHHRIAATKKPTEYLKKIAYYAVEQGNILALQCLVQAGFPINDQIYDNLENLLFIAIRFKKLDVIDWLISQGADLYRQNAHKESIWNVCCKYIQATDTAFVEKIIKLNQNENKLLGDNKTTLFMSAAAGDNIPVMKLLLKLNPNAYLETDCKGKTAFMHAAATGNIRVMELLLKLDANAYLEQDCELQTAFMYAVQANKLTSMQYLLELDEHVYQATDKRGKTAFMHAAHCGHITMMQHLLKLQPDAHLATDNRGRPAFMWAAISGKIAAIKYLSKLNYNVWVKDKAGGDAFTWAATYDHVLVMKYLLSLKSNAYLETDNKGRTAFMWAAGNGKVASLEYLSKLNSNFHLQQDHDGKTAFIIAAAYGKVPAMQYLRKLHAEAHLTPDNDGRTPFIWAVMRGDIPAMKYLLTIKPDLYLHKDNSGCNAFMWSAASGNIAVMKYLLKLQSTAHLSRNNNDVTAFIWAAGEGRIAGMKYLLTLKPDAYLEKDNRGRTAFIIAAMRGHISIMEYLLTLKPDAYLEQDNNGVNACIYAAIYGQLASMKFLLNKDPKAWLTICNNKIVLKYVRQNNYKDCLEFIESMVEWLSYVMEKNANGVMKLLKKHPTFINLQDHLGNTVTHAAFASENINLLEAVLSVNPNLYVKNDNNLIPFEKAAKNPTTCDKKLRCYLKHKFGSDIFFMNNDTNQELKMRYLAELEELKVIFKKYAGALTALLRVNFTPQHALQFASDIDLMDSNSSGFSNANYELSEMLLNGKLTASKSLDSYEFTLPAPNEVISKDTRINTLFAAEHYASKILEANCNDIRALKLIQRVRNVLDDSQQPKLNFYDNISSLNVTSVSDLIRGGTNKIHALSQKNCELQKEIKNLKLKLR